MALRLTLTIAAVLCALAAADFQTKWDSFHGATFDLSPLVHTSGQADYSLTDGDIPCTPVVEQNFTYVFNVAGNVVNTPTVCSGKTAPALQYDPKKGQTSCYSLGSTPTYALLNPNDPSAGVVLTYSQGDQCNHNPLNPGVPLFRSIALQFQCANVAVPAPTAAFEPSHCVYQVAMPSMFGCPLECPIAGRQLCSGHGLCGYDRTNSVAKCFCDTGFAGADCSQPADASSGGNGAIIALLVTVLLIAIVLGVVLFFVIRMLKAYRQDAHNYMAMHNADVGPQDI